MREIRSNRGLAYSAYSYFQVGRRLPGPFVAGSETRSDATTEVVLLMREIMQQMRENEVTDEQLQLARESLINSFVFGFTDNQEIVNTAMRLDFYDYPPDFLASYRDKVAAVGSEDVLRAAREYLRPERQSVILVGDRSAFADLAQKLGLPAKEIPAPTPADARHREGDHK
jgi:zinc protease